MSARTYGVDFLGLVLGMNVAARCVGGLGFSALLFFLRRFFGHSHLLPPNQKLLSFEEMSPAFVEYRLYSVEILAAGPC